MLDSLKRTTWNRTWGIVNLPLAYDDNGNPIMRKGKNGQYIHATNPSLRYLFFELDSLDYGELAEVLKVYFTADIPVYYHRTMRGYHFLSVKPLAKQEHAELIKEIKYLNRDCPHVTIRIKPNKWVGEADIFKIGWIQNGLNDTQDSFYNDTLRLKLWMERQHIGLIRKNYKVVNYQMTGEGTNEPK